MAADDQAGQPKGQSLDPNLHVLKSNPPLGSFIDEIDELFEATPEQLRAMREIAGESQPPQMTEYIPPTWHNNYDNSHLIEVAEDGTIRPKPEYQAYADETNAELERSRSNDRLVWDKVTSSFVVRSLSDEQRGEQNI